jgi:hypothetical protein
MGGRDGALARGLGCVALAALAAAPASAQISGSRLGAREARVPADPTTPDGVRQYVFEYVSCVAGKNRKALKGFLETPPNSAEADRFWASLRIDDCHSIGTLVLTDRGLRGAGYDKMYRLEFGKKGPTDFAGVAEIDYALGLDVAKPVDRNAVALRTFSDCVVRANGEDAQALVLSKIATGAEAKAFDALKPYFKQCLAQGMEITFENGAIRGLVAESLYRLSSAASGTRGERG